MAKPYSMDLRERVMRRAHAGESARRVAAALSVAPSTVVKWAQRFRATGRVAPGKTAAIGRARSQASTRLGFARIGRDGFTLRGLVVELAERGLKVDYRTMWRFVHRERLQKSRFNLTDGIS